MVGALMLAFGAIGTIKESLYENKMSYEFLEISKGVCGEIYEVGDKKYLKDGNVEVKLWHNCFGETYAFNTKYNKGREIFVNYGYVESPEDTKLPGLDSTTYYINGYDSFIYGLANPAYNLYRDKDSNRRLCEWNGIYFDADSSSPVRFVNQEECVDFDTSNSHELEYVGDGVYKRVCGKTKYANYSLNKIWVANEILKDKTGFGFWQFAVTNNLHEVLRDINFESEANEDLVAFREKCMCVCPEWEKEIFVEDVKDLYNIYIPDTSYSMTEWKRRNMQCGEYRPIR